LEDLEARAPAKAADFLESFLTKHECLARGDVEAPNDSPSLVTNLSTMPRRTKKAYAMGSSILRCGGRRQRRAGSTDALALSEEFHFLRVIDVARSRAKGDRRANRLYLGGVSSASKAETT
jgi:hypothetical protein